MTKADIPAGVRLKEIAGWNQTAADWKGFSKPARKGALSRSTTEGCAAQQPPSRSRIDLHGSGWYWLTRNIADKVSEPSFSQ